MKLCEFFRRQLWFLSITTSLCYISLFILNACSDLHEKLKIYAVPLVNPKVRDEKITDHEKQKLYESSTLQKAFI